MYYTIPNTLILKLIQSVESVEGTTDSRLPRSVVGELLNFIEAAGGSKPGSIVYKDLEFHIIQPDNRLKTLKLDYCTDILKEIIEGPKTSEYLKNRFFRFHKSQDGSLSQAILKIRNELRRCDSSKNLVHEKGEYLFK